jgi:hypothetical protein
MNYTAEIIAVGTELLLGSIVNSDAKEISETSPVSVSTFTFTQWWETIPPG